jgi:hypothetical protein
MTFPCLMYDGGPDEEEMERLSQLPDRLQQDIYTPEALPALLQRGIPHEVVVSECVVKELPLRLKALGREIVEWSQEAGFLRVSPPHTYLDCYAQSLDMSDRHLYLEATANGCDAFMTTDYRTIGSRRSSLSAQMARVVTPTEWWDAMKPWAALFL